MFIALSLASRYNAKLESLRSSIAPRRVFRIIGSQNKSMAEQHRSSGASMAGNIGNSAHVISSSCRLPQSRARCLASTGTGGRLFAASYVPVAFSGARAGAGAENQLHELSYKEEPNELVLAKSHELPSICPGAMAVTAKGKKLAIAGVGPSGGSAMKNGATAQHLSAKCLVANVEDPGSSSGMGDESYNFAEIVIPPPAAAATGSGTSVSSSSRPFNPTTIAFDSFRPERVLVGGGGRACLLDLGSCGNMSASGLQELLPGPQQSDQSPGFHEGDSDAPQTLNAACFDPHHSELVAVAMNGDVRILDLRTQVATTRPPFLEARDCHAWGVLCLAYNPNTPNQLLTAGRDACWKLWDLRKKEMACVIHSPAAHSHWITQVGYNPFHDQLLATAGSDSNVQLWKTTAGAGGTRSKLVQQTQHEDSVYALCWHDAWHYASLSYDGNVVVSRVPMEEKYRILL